MDDCLEFESNPEMVTAARRFVRDRLESWDVAEHLDSAVLVASELVTNAVLHARTAVVLRVEARPSRVRIEVYDENPRLPVVSPAPPDATSGRGLALVSAVSQAWGMENRDQGKIVWAEVGDGDEPAPSDDCVDLTAVTTVDEAVEQIEQTSPADPIT
ncbi:MAG: ATP-binding protein [Acidobacteriota bacterium]|nr:ATP-binding protein [Acidobacteriota bacterium]